jgi:hypothetical protein
MAPGSVAQYHDIRSPRRMRGEELTYPITRSEHGRANLRAVISGRPSGPKSNRASCMCKYYVVRKRAGERATGEPTTRAPSK